MNPETFLENPEGIESLSETERDALQDALRARAIEAGHLPRDLIPLARMLSPRVELTLEGLRVCAYPAGEHLAMRILRRADIPKEHASSFAAPRERDYAVAFVDPQALSYRNFENILPLDDHFKGVRCTLQDHTTVQDVLHTLRLRGPTARLKSLHDASRDHISRYTLLLYVTGGVGTPALEVAGAALDDIDVLVTDDRIDASSAEILTEAGIDVRIA